ncbi:transposase [Streptomyces sp. NPDC052013]|uniref:transposase n=1 Tax=Streptomyces sp. NPDC052013 TaxID=3365679 RepID=UPI0037D2D62A
MGTSRGGYTAKIHLAAEGRSGLPPPSRPRAATADGPQRPHVPEQVRVPRTQAGRPRTRPGHVLADTAYASRANRRYLRRRGIHETIPEGLDQQRHRGNRGSRGGRPLALDSKRYNKRSTVECAVNRLQRLPGRGHPLQETRVCKYFGVAGLVGRVRFDGW